tara:strand:- start:159 stop:458 length:300 start_codon:yes stop_codon:yes gene_type:complete
MNNKNFTRKNIVKKIYEKLGFSKNFSSTVIDSFFELIILDILQSKTVKISSFGTFKVIQKNQRIGRNPKTKVEAKISARKIVKFKPSNIVKYKINNNGN